MKKSLFFIFILTLLFPTTGNIVSAQSAPDFIISCSPASLTVDRGEVASWNVTVSSENGFSGNVQVLYPGATGETPGPVQTVAVPTGGSVSTVVTMTVSIDHATGTFFRRINGVSGSLVDSCYFTLIVDSGTRVIQTVDVKANGGDGPIYIAYGASPVISWTSQDSTWCEVEAGGSVALEGSASGYMLVSNGPISGSATAQPQYGNGYYTLVCSNGSTDVVIVNILSNGDEDLEPTGNILCVNSIGIEVAGPCTIASGSSTFISWTSQNAQECEVTSTGMPATIYWTALAGYESTGSLTSTRIYVLSCDGVLIRAVTVNVISAVLQVSSNTANNSGPFVDGLLELPATGVQVRLKATCGASGGSGRISPGSINFAGTSYYGNVTFNTSPKTWTLTCYPSPNQSGTPTATDFVTVQLTSPDFTLACNTVSKTVTAGASTIFDTTVTAINGFASLVTVDITAGLPAGASDTPVSVTPTAVASVPVSTLVTTPAGTSNLTFTATGGGKSHTCISQLIVTDDSDPYLVSLDIAPADSTILVNDTQSYTAEASYSDGSSASVTGSTTFGTSDENIARASGAAEFLGTTDGSVTITGTYIEGIITTADTANLEVGSGAVGGLSASVACPSGENTCTIPYNTSINLTWTSTGADSGCSMSPALIPAVNTESGTASTGNLTDTTVYTLTCTGPDKFTPPATDTATVIVNPPSESFANTDKDITSINGIAITNGSCNGGTDSIAKTFASADEVSFKVNLCNTGSSPASNIVITDELINLAVPSGGWNAEYDGVAIVPVESGTSPNQTLTFTLPGTVTAGSTKSLTFDAVVTPPAPITNTIYRFQNIARISTANGSWTSSTPLYLFYAGSRVPSKQEIAP